MAESTTFVEAAADVYDQIIVEALDYANNTSGNTHTRDPRVEVNTSRCVYCDHYNNVYGALQDKLRQIGLLERTSIQKSEVIQTLQSCIEELENDVSREQRQNHNLRQKYERECQRHVRERAYSRGLTRSLLTAHERTLTLRNQATEFENSKAALTEELQKKYATIQDLEEQNHHLRAVVNEVATRMCNAKHRTPLEAREDDVREGPSQSPDDHEDSSTHQSQAAQTSHNAPTAAPAQPIDSILEPSPSSDSANDPALTILISYIPTWIRSCFKPAEPREADPHKNQCDPKPSNPEIKAKAKRQTVDPKASRTRDYAASCRFSDETAEQSVKSAEFLALRRKQEQEEQQWFRQGVQPMTRASADGEAGTHENGETML